MLIFGMRFIFYTLLMIFPVLCWSSNNIVSIEMSGIPKEQQAVILSNLSIKKSEQDKHLTEEQVYSLYQTGIAEIATTLESIGYYHAKIAHHFSCEKNQNKYRVKYLITLGKPVLVKSVNVVLTGEGKNQPALQFMLLHPALKINKILEHNKYEAFKQNLLGTALQLGYLDAHFVTNKVLVDTIKNHAIVVLELDTGKLYTFGKIDFISPPYPPEYLKQYVPFSAGVPYTTDRLLSLQKNLTDTDLFSKVKLSPDLNGIQHDAVPVHITLMPKPSNRYTASLGYGTDSGSRGMVGWERRRKSYPGHRININFKGSKRFNQANAQYTILGKNPATDRLAFGTQITEEKPVDKKYSLQNETGVTHIKKRGHFEQILGLHYLSVAFRDLPTDPKNHSHFLLPSIGGVWSSIRKETLLQEGARISINLQGSVKSVFSTTNMAQAVARLKWITPLTDTSRIILRGNIGSIATHEFNKIPWNLRFFTGGDHTVRGFGYNSIGPTEPDLNGNLIVVGGRHLAVGSIELEKKIYKKIGIAMFVDSGNAMNKWKSRLKTGAGFGVRYETPLGPLRLDIARPMMSGKQKPRFHLTFGMDL